MPKKNQEIQEDNHHGPFLRLGGHPILDFVNTKVRHSSSTEDRLENLKLGELFFAQILHVKIRLNEKEFAKALELRQLFREFFESLILKSQIEDKLFRLNEVLSRLRYSPSLQTLENADKIQRIWNPEKEEAAQETALVFQLLHFFDVADLNRLKKCANPNCSHLFYDSSKNNTRSWCSMKSCGNLMKARAFYERKKNAKSDLD